MRIDALSPLSFKDLNDGRIFLLELDEDGKDVKLDLDGVRVVVAEKELLEIEDVLVEKVVLDFDGVLDHDDSGLEEL